MPNSPVAKSATTRTPRQALDAALFNIHSQMSNEAIVEHVDRESGYSAMAEALRRTLAYLYTTDDYKLGRVSNAILDPARAALEIVYGVKS